MNRRTFVLLGGTALLWPGARPVPARSLADGRLRFTLDQRRRWSVWYMSSDASLPLLQDADLGAWVGDRFVTLADLEDITEGTRRPPGGEALVLRGRAAGVYLEAEFAWETGANPVPRGSVSLRIYPDRDLPTIRGVGYAAVDGATVLPGTEPLLALLNGRTSPDPCRVERVAPGASPAVSYAACGLTRGARGLALAFDSAEPGEGRLSLDNGRIEIATDWRPARPVFPQGDVGTLRIAYDPAGDGLSALRTLWSPSSPVDLERLTAAIAPAGWSSRFTTTSEEAVIANLELTARQFDRHDLRVIQVDDGYQRALGNWDANARFPHGHRWLTDRIHTLGLQAGIWIAPFGVSEASGIPAAHGDWLLRRGGAPVALATRESWGGKVFGLDAARPAVQEWLFELGRRVVRDWGYDFVKADQLDWACAGEAYAGGLTRAEAYRRGLSALRDGLGADTFLLGAGAPLQHSAGLVNGMRVGPDAAPTWGSVQPPAGGAALRAFYQRTVWLNDPDCLLVGESLSAAEARAWTSVVAMAGGVAMLGDDLTKLPAERLALVQRALPSAAVAGWPVGALREERDVAPAIGAGTATHPITGTWRFRTGDDAAYAAAGFDDSVWEATEVPGAWESRGRADYDGFAWYRVRFNLPAALATDGAAAWLELGKVDDADETFINGTKIGQTGALPPAYRGDRSAYRRYAVPSGLLNWGGENVLAVRVYDGGGEGGLWTVRRSRPADAWVAQGREQWWTVALVNWDDEKRKVTLPLAAAGISEKKLHAFDVWNARPLADVAATLEAELDPHDAVVVALRPVATRPVILGSTRHLIQGAVDIAAEEWTAATRTLAVRSQRLDARPYAVTVTVPRGLVPAGCTSDIPCTMSRLPSGHVKLEWSGGTAAREISWSLKFRTAARRPA